MRLRLLPRIFLQPAELAKRNAPARRPAAWLRAGTLALGLVIQAGCESTNSVSAEDSYQEPRPGATVASIRGSSIDEGGFFGSLHRGFVGMVDLKTVPDAADRWNQPLLLSPGRHTIAAEYRYSNFMTRAYLQLDAKAGVNYQLMIKYGREGPLEDRPYNDFWIVDLATGNAVTVVSRQQVTGGKPPGTMFYKTN